MMRIRPFRPGDEPALAEICLKTADAGADATGLLDDDDLWAEIFVLPYAARHPEFAFVVETDDDRVVGYVVGAPDSAAFEDWFQTEWWPRFAERWPRPQGDPLPVSASRQDGIVRYAYARRGGAQPFGDEYPAHLHIDLLPETQGQGLGRRLIETLENALREAGVPGLHLVASSENTGAIAFYPRVGFAPLPSPEGTQVFATRL
ncbi:GNAT family N-acetyltransferase [Microbacterium trichothecenolyticum]|uniref:GNAT family N-acetyltransferase n=1 Tax=Microbacterium ureisolvens TaxID=2781186 RepID=A0ABS7I0L0_9MICO|nr:MULTISPECIES: GNAT family N-acetyltransferase [Microbacterium]MBW9111187.1 GNAT family N-acetyltransferase [Microbacterium ureisolvens]MBW9121337.1 GNAT family N-acetyltransferase [Microbacterium trichothecenolyticum]